MAVPLEKVLRADHPRIDSGVDQALFFICDLGGLLSAKSVFMVSPVHRSFRRVFVLLSPGISRVLSVIGFRISIVKTSANLW